ncbi:methyltransferase domain-containing protein [Amycolatopsis sp. NPDC098790]|uniref:methyltransferase domain-containing protein n=1 Tax=Amycolatopsis sp. NPDC098790 TaxID=3363939 RepID=UPI0038091EC3
MTFTDVPGTFSCRICGGAAREFLDLGRQPVSNAFVRPEDVEDEVFFRLTVGVCDVCCMVQQREEVPRENMFHADYPYRSSGSEAMRRHFRGVAEHLIETELAADNAFAVEIGSNDGIFLETIHQAGIRHLGVDPSGGVSESAKDKGIRVLVDFFTAESGAQVRGTEGPADLIFSANCISHIAYIDSIFKGVDALLAPTGVFVFEDRYLGDIVDHLSFDQIYDEHYYLFSVTAVRNLAATFGFELVDVEHLGVHGGSVRYSVARVGARRVSPRVTQYLEHERERGYGTLPTLTRFADTVKRICSDLVEVLETLRAEGKTVVGYGATSKSATIVNFAGIGPGHVSYVCDSTPEKQGRLTPGAHIPIRPSEAFSAPYPDYAVLFAWNHATEILAKEQEFTAQGGRWVLYVPDVHVLEHGELPAVP